MAALESEVGKYDIKTASRAFVRAAVWAGVLESTLDERGRETDQTPTLYEVGRWLDNADVSEVTRIVFRALELARVPDRPTQASGETSKPISYSHGVSADTISGSQSASSGA
jgi:hypothetical protein